LEEPQNGNAEDLRRAREAEMKMRLFSKQALSQEAFERLSNIRAANPELYVRIIELLAALARAGKLEGKMPDAEFKRLVERVLPPRRETRIIRK